MATEINKRPREKVNLTRVYTSLEPTKAVTVLLNILLVISDETLVILMIYLAKGA